MNRATSQEIQDRLDQLKAYRFDNDRRRTIKGIKKVINKKFVNVNNMKKLQQLKSQLEFESF